MLCVILSLAIPSLRWLVPMFIILISLYLFINAEVFASSDRNSPRWRTYRYLIMFGLVVALCIYLISYLNLNAVEGISSNLLITIFIMVFGNLAPKIPFNRYLGLRLPWTVANERVWRYAHRIVGYCTIPCVAMLLLAIFYKIELLYGIGIVSWVLIPAFLSYRYDKLETTTYKIK